MGGIASTLPAPFQDVAVQGKIYPKPHPWMVRLASELGMTWHNFYDTYGDVEASCRPEDRQWLIKVRGTFLQTGCYDGIDNAEFGMHFIVQMRLIGG